ncbi:MAG: hypothetical protein K9M45_02385 [Kiritimatiellales bacterium]|nr:hypothetical protein [Kiritimatiellales bacterium]
MPTTQTRDVLEQARTFHRRLSGFYEELKDSVHRERTRILLDYMSRHEDYLANSLGAFEEAVSNNVLDTYFQFSFEDATISCFADFEIKAEMDVNDVIQAAMHFDSCLIAFYKEMAERTVSGEIREIFENLLELEKHEQVALSKRALEFDSL